jgi:hypothetical protein
LCSYFSNLSNQNEKVDLPLLTKSTVRKEAIYIKIQPFRARTCIFMISPDVFTMLALPQPHHHEQEWELEWVLEHEHDWFCPYHGADGSWWRGGGDGGLWGYAGGIDGGGCVL